MKKVLTSEDKSKLTTAVMQTLRAWEVPLEMQPKLLGLEQSFRRRESRRFTSGIPLPDEGDLYERVLLLLKIDDAAQKMFPHSPMAANLWVTTPRIRFGQRTPLDLMIEHGIDGIRQVLRVLDHSEPLYTEFLTQRPQRSPKD